MCKGRQISNIRKVLNSRIYIYILIKLSHVQVFWRNHFSSTKKGYTEHWPTMQRPWAGFPVLLEGGGEHLYKKEKISQKHKVRQTVKTIF